jgi:hypothetical protein
VRLVVAVEAVENSRSYTVFGTVDETGLANLDEIAA